MNLVSVVQVRNINVVVVPYKKIKEEIKRINTTDNDISTFLDLNI